MVRALLLALVVLAAGAPAASAHAVLVSTAPARGVTVERQPRQVVLAFDEAVEGSFGAVRVFDARARRVDDGDVTHPGGESERVAVGLKPGLAKGTYTATFRVVSADGHPIAGGFVFNVGRAGAAPAASVADLAGPTTTGSVTRAAQAAAKALGYLAIALALGGLAFLALVWRPALGAVAGAGGAWTEAAAAFAARARRLLAAAVALGLAATAASYVLQGAAAAGLSAWAALDSRVLRDLLDTHTGAALALRFGAWLSLGAMLATLARREVPALRRVALGADGALAPPAPGLPARGALLVAGAVLALTPALAGHPAAQSPRGLLTALDVVHVLAMSAWLGGLAFLLAALPAATRRLDAPERSRLLAAALARFSPIALASVGALLATGVAQAVLHLDALGDLTGSAFGRAVAIKAAIALVLVALGALQRRRIMPALGRVAGGGEAPGAAGRLLRRTLRAEVALVVVVLGVTGVLTGTSPPGATAAGPFSATQRLGPLTLEAVVDPARPGANAAHFYVLRARDGAPFAGLRELRVRASLPAKGIGPLPVTVRTAGPGHAVATDVPLSPAGTWHLEVTARVSEFDEHRTVLEVPVR